MRVLRRLWRSCVDMIRRPSWFSSAAGRSGGARCPCGRCAGGAATDGWVTVDVRDAARVQNENFGDACIFEDYERAPFAEIGYTLCVLQPGQPNGMYHREDNQEDFLVLQ